MHTLFLLMIAMAGTLGPTKPKLIQWGAFAPNNGDLRKDMAKYEAAPFDGVVFGAIGKEGDQVLDLQWECWGKRAFTREQFANVVEDLKASKRTRFTDCFLRFNVTPGDVNWLDDQAWSVVLNNAKLAAWIAKEGGVKGWMFDTEMYVKHLFYYQDQKAQKPASFEEYQKVVRQRGNEFMRAINSEYADLTILMTYAHGIVVPEGHNLPHSLLGLLPAFVDGMLEAADEKTTLVDVCEMAYAAKTREDFDVLIKRIREGGRKLSAVPEIYDKRLKIGFGIWIDYKGDNRPWDPHHTEKNYFQPHELNESLKLALELTDGYVWLYSERLNWYTRDGITEPYIHAVASAQAPPKKVPASKPSP